MAVDEQTLRMMAALLQNRPPQPQLQNAVANSIYRHMETQPRGWLREPLPMQGRATLLPLRRTDWPMIGNREWALPGIVAGAVNAFTAPGRALRNQSGFDPLQEGVNFGLTFTGGGLGGSRAAPPPRGSIGMNSLPPKPPAPPKPPLDDYAGLHRPPMKDSGAPGHDLTGSGAIYPDDVYSSRGAQYYGTGDAGLDSQTFAVAQSIRGKPDAMVTIYRAVPASSEARLAKLEGYKREYMRRGKVPEDYSPKSFYDDVTREIEQLRANPSQAISSINRGDWVTVNRKYAVQHGESALRGDYEIISKRVRARDIYTNGDSIHEWGYDPD